MKPTHVFLPLVALTTAPASAELPEPVRQMIAAAIATGDPAKVDTLVEIASATHPGGAAEIEAMAAEFRAGQAARAAAASLFVRPRSDPPNMLTAPKERPSPATVTPTKIAHPRSKRGARAAMAATA